MEDPVSLIKEPTAHSAENFEKVLTTASTYLQDTDIKKLVDSYEFASGAHEGQCRKNGEPFINHPVETALILAELRMDVDTIIAAILHDTVEDSSVTVEQVEAKFGKEVAELVDGVTKITRIEIESLTEAQANTLRKMLIAMSKDIRVIVIKLADRLHNMRTLMALREDRRIFKARETMEIYAPLAHRLGISSIKWELEDLSFFYLEPAKFQQVSKMVAESRAAREAYLDETIIALRGELEKLGIKAKISGRPKHLYSIYQKMSQKGKDFSEIYDLIALRIIVDTVKDCYTALGAVHTLWHPMPGRFKDYIAMPKFNMYQSLHTTVIGIAGRPLEIQIRTMEMHRMSEYGVAAHWRYKEGEGAPKRKDFDERLAWLRQMLDWQSDTEDPKEFIEGLKIGLFETEVFVFTPKGEVISLRSGATPIDFAYAIHTEVGHHCVGAKVNGSIVPLSYELQMGDRVEILTQKASTPSRDWLNNVRTPSARSKIRTYFSKISRGDDLLHGRDQLVHEMRKHGVGMSSTTSLRAVEDVAKTLGYPGGDDLMVAIGAGKLSAKLISNKLLRLLLKDSGQAAENVNVLPGFTLETPMIAPRKHRNKTNDAGIEVRGIDDVLVRLARCCNPVPGDEITGFVTRGRGVSVHRSNCPNTVSLLETPERVIDVSWAGKGASSFQLEILVEALDRLRLLQDVTIALADTGVNILGSSTQTHKDGLVEMRFLLEMTEAARIEQILRDLRAIEGVFGARRMVAGESVKKRKN
ncbi:MAG: bifunctional (p)ppGpp synthetase/guanosine-3',5'-bis(diphosphate) 3'-pyrophosphohydrolase [Actinobacteria bacterium]|nr:bifunctional (p)ppGpp synthetase/guanosine-3',5'-bis(diphosphate) 3'-pyrophosphohydrolase [Actinomycetota bacterium]